MDSLTWTNDKRKLRDLIEWEKNPKQIKKDNARRLRQSLKKFSQVLPLAIGPDNTIYDGHQRKRVWELADEFGPGYEVDVRVSSRALSEDEQKELTILLYKGAVGETDYDFLANYFDLDDLEEWGYPLSELDMSLWDVGGNGGEEMANCPNCGQSISTMSFVSNG